jgi:hypothetical protein
MTDTTYDVALASQQHYTADDPQPHPLETNISGERVNQLIEIHGDDVLLTVNTLGDQAGDA